MRHRSSLQHLHALSKRGLCMVTAWLPRISEHRHSLQAQQHADEQAQGAGHPGRHREDHPQQELRYDASGGGKAPHELGHGLHQRPFLAEGVDLRPGRFKGIQQDSQAPAGQEQEDAQPGLQHPAPRRRGPAQAREVDQRHAQRQGHEVAQEPGSSAAPAGQGQQGRFSVHQVPSQGVEDREEGRPRGRDDPHALGVRAELQHVHVLGKEDHQGGRERPIGREGKAKPPAVGVAARAPRAHARQRGGGWLDEEAAKSLGAACL
mmetsp:Transcript_125735/g.367409  ORF Transcript_125735/g.367409 Transcript_125735/m.367409 type:complete len:263 (+) Transcript_125735:1049-1837(+)